MNPVPNPSSTDLPQPTLDALAHSARVSAHIRAEIAAAGGWIAFSRYMELALYAPGLGYYSAGARKLGSAGDFVTAPEMTPLFGQVLARQVADLFTAVPDGRSNESSGVSTSESSANLPGTLPRSVLEVGAGSGALAASMLEALEALGALPEEYLILELSADLRQRSRDMLRSRVPHLVERVAWLNQLPPAWSGVVIGNEVLDAMPVEIFRTAAEPIGPAGGQAGAQEVAQEVEQAGVVVSGDGFDWAYRPARRALRDAVRELQLPPGYTSEMQIVACAFIASLAAMLERGVALFIDYGFPRREYYHAQRSEGTLMCHYRHRAHANPFFLPGLQDITSHVDFSAVARSAAAAGMQVAGYASQAQFLINCGITELLAQQLPQAGEPQANYLSTSNAAQRLLSPAEMGELFKVVALEKGTGDAAPLTGFARGDKTDTL